MHDAYSLSSFELIPNNMHHATVASVAGWGYTTIVLTIVFIIQSQLV